MSNITLIIQILVITLVTVCTICSADMNNKYYSGFSFDPEIIPSGMISYDDSGWSHGILFSAPNWLLLQIDPNLTSTVLDRRVNPGTITFPINQGNKYYVFNQPTHVNPSSPFPSMSNQEQKNQNQADGYMFQQPDSGYSPFITT